MEKKMYEFDPRENAMDEVGVGEIDEELDDDVTVQNGIFRDICSIPEKISKSLSIDKDVDAIKKMVDEEGFARIDKMIEADKLLTTPQKADELRKNMNERAEQYRKASDTVNSQRDNKAKNARIIGGVIVGVIVAIGEIVVWRRRK